MKIPGREIMIIACVMMNVFLLPCHAEKKESRIDFIAQPRSILIKAGNQSLATYVYKDPKISRPYFKDLFAPDAIQVSRHHPPRPGIDPTDHVHYHPGLWLAFGDLNGADSWRNKAPVKHIEFINPPCVTGDRGSFTVRNRYLNQDQIICEEICEYIFLIRPAGYLILWDSTFQSDQNDFWFGDQEEMGLGVRMATSIMVKSKQGGRILDNEGRKNEKGIWGKQALWCDYSGWIDKTFAGITIMPNPDNFRPCRWHCRDYGFMAANPFGCKAFKAGAKSKVSVKKGTSFPLSYGILIHSGKSDNSIDLAAAYKGYLIQLKILQEEKKKEEEE